MALKQFNYDDFAKFYDDIELSGRPESEELNSFLDRMFRENDVSTVADMTCGTGAQAIGLAKRGFQVRASDLSEEMLRVARKKARGLGIRFRQGDVRTVRLGRFDAVITMYCAIGHLTPSQFATALSNIASQLTPGGLFAFDIFNLEALRRSLIRHRFMDRAGTAGDLRFVRFNKNTLDARRGIFHINHELYLQHGFNKPTVRKSSVDLQVYTPDQLRTLVSRAGFAHARIFESPGKKFKGAQSLVALVVAQR